MKKVSINDVWHKGIFHSDECIDKGFFPYEPFFGNKHLPPGSNIPDPAPLPPPPVPWWKMLPALIPDPFPIIINPCVINPFSPWCGDNSA
jgi:hypothetical protein